MASGNMFGVGKGSDKPIEEVAKRFAFKAADSAPKKSGSKSSGKKKTSSKKVKNPLETPETPTISNLKQLKDLIGKAPPGFLESLDDNTKDLIKKIQSGELDNEDPQKLKRLLQSTSLSTQASYQTNTSGFLRSGYTAEMRKTQKKVDSDRQLENLANETAQRLVALSDEEWKAAGIEKPDFSKPLSLEQLVQFDGYLGKRGITTGDFSKYLTKAEMDFLDTSGDLVKPDLGAPDSPMEVARKKKKKQHLEVDLFADEETLNARTKREYINRVSGLRPGDLARTMINMVRKGKQSEAVTLFEDALTWDPKIVGFEPIDMQCINTVISIHCFARETAKALRTFDLIEKYHYVPDTITFNAFINMGAALRDDRVCLQWYNKLVESRVKPDSVTFGALISCYGQVGDAANALKWFHEMREKVEKPDSTPYAHMIHMYGMVLDDVPEALKWARQMLDDKVVRNDFTSSVIADLHRKLQFKKAQENQTERDRKKSPQELLLVAIHESNHEAAQKLWDSIRYNKLPINESIWSAMINYYARIAKLDKAVALYNEMLEMGFRPSRATCATMVQVFHRLGDSDKAQQVLAMVGSAPATEPLPEIKNSELASPFPERSRTNKSGIKIL
jgi:pentatricopeptide repeat protein